MGAHLFLLPHQDDEFGVFHAIDRLVASEQPCWFVYITDGAYRKATPAIRNAESRVVLRRLGTAPDRMIPFGTQHGIPAEQVPDRLEQIFADLCRLIERIGPITSIWTPAWEGGHPDHDATVLLALALARHIGRPEAAWQFPLYNGYACKLRPFRVFAPIPEGGPVTAESIPLARRPEHLKLIGLYKSQRKTFAILFPFIVLHYALIGAHYRQAIEPKLVFRPPHGSLLLYERRGWLTWNAFEKKVDRFRAGRLG